MSTDLSSPPRVFAVLNGKYKYAALHDLIKLPKIEIRLSIASGHPLDPYYLPLLAAGAVVYSGDDVKNMLKGADVVISYTASEAGLCSQLKFIRLSAEAGVKLFIPCEYTLEYESYETSPHVNGKTSTVEDVKDETYALVKLRREAIDLCKEVGLPSLRIVTGIIPENFLVDEQRHPYIDEASSYNWKLTQRKVTIFGTGDVPITFTPKEYYRAWFTHFITTTPLSELTTLGTVYLSGETLTQNQVIKLWEKKHSDKLDVTYITGDELFEIEKKLLADKIHNYWTQYPFFVQLDVAKGGGKISHETSPSTYSGKVWKVEDIL